MKTAPPEFRLDEATHTYFLGDRVLPGTTDMLKSNGVIDSTWFNESARIRGNAVHQACHYLAEGQLNWATVKEEIKGYVDAYQKAADDLDFVPELCEQIFMHPIYLYGTKPDQIGYFKGKEGILELKAGVMQPWTSLQTSFQAMAVWPADYFSKVRVGLELHSTGTYRTEVHQYEDFEVALSMYTVHQWKQKNQKKEI